MANIPSKQGLLRLVIASKVQDISFPLPNNKEITLGREPSCDIPLDSYTSVSRHHATIRPMNTAAGEWAIYDLNSANGTYINGQRLQGGQVLRKGDRIQLALDGAEFLFDYEEQNYSLPSKLNTPQPIVIQNQTIKEKDYRIELLPRKLEIYITNPFGNIFGILFITIFLAINPGVFILGFAGAITSYPLIVYILYLIIIIGYNFFRLQDIYYSFDLETSNLIIDSQKLVSRLFRLYHQTKYSLDEFTAVRLEKSEYKGDEGTHYDDYAIYLDRENSKPIKLNHSWRNQPEKARELVDLIEMYLQQVEA